MGSLSIIYRKISELKPYPRNARTHTRKQAKQIAAPIQEFGFTAGYGGILGGNLLYSLGAEVGTRGTTSGGLIKENYFQISFTINYRDFLYSKGRKFF